MAFIHRQKLADQIKRQNLMNFPLARTEYDQTFAFLCRKSKRTIQKVACKATKSPNDIFKALAKGTAPAPSCAKVPSIITTAAQQDAAAATAGLLMLQTLQESGFHLGIVKMSFGALWM